MDPARCAWRQLRDRDDVAEVNVRTPEQGLQELRDAGLGEAIDALNDNPLPSLLVITPGQGKDDARLARALESLPEADLVQHDALWRQRLDAWLAFGARLVQVLSVLLGVGAALVVGNTVRLDIQARREEIGVLQLLGASDGFIRRPFLYLGAWYGLGAGAVALGLIGAAGAAARAAGRTLAQLWQPVRAARPGPAARWPGPARHAAAGLAGRLAGHRPLPPPDPPDRHLRPACNRKR